jgi:thioredoxin
MQAYQPGKTLDVDMNNFEVLVEQHPYLILDFWAEWCGPCRAFAPAFETMAELHPDVVFGKVNVEVARDLAEAFQIRSIPTLMAFRQGDLVFEQPGVLPVEQFEKLVQSLKQ